MLKSNIKGSVAQNSFYVSFSFSYFYGYGHFAMNKIKPLMMRPPKRYLGVFA